MPSAFRVGVVGAGAVTELFHLPATMLVPECHVVAVVDLDSNRAQTLASRWGITEAGISYESLLGKVDGVLLNTPPHTRGGIGKDLLRRGIPVLCEKPLASTRRDAERLLEAAAAGGAVLSVGHVRRAYPNRQALRQMLRCGVIGRPVAVDVEEGMSYSWPTVSGYTFQRSNGGGVLLDTGAHTLDELLWLFGDVTDLEYRDDALGGVESNVELVLRFQSEIEAVYRLSRTRQFRNRIRITGQLGTLRVEVGDWTSLTLERRTVAGSRRVAVQCGDPSLTFLEIMARQLRRFIASVQSGAEPLSTGQDGYRVVDLVERCYESVATRPLPAVAPPPGTIR